MAVSTPFFVNHVLSRIGGRAKTYLNPDSSLPHFSQCRRVQLAAHTLSSVQLTRLHREDLTAYERCARSRAAMLVLPRIFLMPIIPDTDVSQYAVTRGRFDNKRVASLLTGILGTETFSRLRKAKVDERMMFGSNPYYLSLAMGGGLKTPPGPRFTSHATKPSPARTHITEGRRDY